MNYRALATAVATILIGGGLWFYGAPEPAKPVEKTSEESAPKLAQGVGIIDIDKIRAAHPEGAHLDELRSTELRLRLELNAAMKIVEMPKPPPPDPNAEVFDEAAWQKNAQRVISQLAALESKKKLLAEEYRKKTEPRYIEERNKIRDEFMNENMNIQLKLRNADNLHLSQDKVNELLARLDELELERNNRTAELLKRWTAEVLKYAEDSVAEEEARLKAEAAQLQAVMEEQARQKESDVTERNKQLMENALREMESRQVRRRELFTQLTEVSRERSELEKKILDSITDKATMLAAVNRLEMIFIKRTPDLNEKISLRHIESNFNLKEPARVGAVIFPGKDARDLTDDLIKEMNRL